MTTAKLIAKSIEVPDEVLEALGLNEGDEFDVMVEDKSIVFTPQKNDHPEHVAYIRALVAQGREDFYAGHTLGPFDSLEEFEKALDKKA